MRANSIALDRQNRAPTARTRPHRVPDSDTAMRRLSILTSAVEQEVIPRLLERLTPERDGARARDRVTVTESQVSHLVELTLEPASPASVAFVAGLLEEGFGAEALYLDLLAPAAARLGQMWVDDVCSFADVTIGLVRLQQAMRALGDAFFGPRFRPSPGGPRALLLPYLGEQHTFGLSMLSDFFRRAGWDTWHGLVADAAELRAMVRAEWVDLLGFSLSCDDAARRGTRRDRPGPPGVAQPGAGGHGRRAALCRRPVAGRRNRRRRHRTRRAAGGGLGSDVAAAARQAALMQRQRWQ